ncbi:MAG: restriction endonuclease subunit S [bacterium]|nr:restriction endonuclease subunit S [bacterium]
MDQVTTKAVGRKQADLPYVGLEHVASGTRTLISTAPSSVSVSANGVFESGDVLFGKLRPNLRKAVQMTFGGYCSTDFLVLRPRSGVDPRFAGHAASSDAIFRHAERNSIGTGMPRTSWLAVSQAPISVPPLDEQRRIAEILDTLDETIQATERVIAKSGAVRAGLASDLLGGGVGVAGRLNWKTRELPPIAPATKSDRPGMDDWSYLRLSDIGAIVGGGTPYRESPQCWDGAIPWLTPGELTDNTPKFVFDTQDRITEKGLSSSGARLLPKDTLMVTSRASLGSVALAGRPMATNQGFKNLIPGPGVDSSYLFHLGRTLGREMLRRASGTTFLEVSGREFGQIEVRVPPLEAQRRIAESLDAADYDIEADEMRLEKLRRLRSGLASDLLSGRVRTVAA